MVCPGTQKWLGSSMLTWALCTVVLPREGNILQDKLIFPLSHLAPRTSPADGPMPSRQTLGATSSSHGSRRLPGGDRDSSGGSGASGRSLQREARRGWGS